MLMVMKTLFRTSITVTTCASLLFPCVIHADMTDSSVLPQSASVNAARRPVAPPHRPKPSPQPKPTVLATGMDGFTYDASAGNAAGWINGNKNNVFDLSHTASLRITFPPTAIGDHFFVRLMPLSQMSLASYPDWLNLKVYTVPAFGVVTIPLSDFTSGTLENNHKMTSDLLSQIGQISVHSGSNAWYISLNQDASKRAFFTSIDAVPSASHPISRDSASAATLLGSDSTSASKPQNITGDSVSYLPLLGAQGQQHLHSSSDSNQFKNPFSAINNPTLSSHDVSLPQ